MALPSSRKRLGQHFLFDPAVIGEIVAAIGASDTLVEIGPGRGALTVPLAEQTRHLIAIEKDPDLARRLMRDFAGNPAVCIRCADALREGPAAYPAGARLAGNLPYSVATALLQRWMDMRARFADLTVMVQREVAQRLAAPPGDPARGQLSVVAQLLMEVDVLFDVGPECFDPPPQVVSSVLRLVPRKVLPVGEHEREGLVRLVRRAFASRRKTLHNNFPAISRPTWARADLDPRRRAETLSEEEFVRLFREVDGPERKQARDEGVADPL